jgi:hypothetical protein
MLSDEWYMLWKNKVNINNSFWDNIEWIDWNSVDIIFINHVITKATVNPIKILQQADKLLCNNWTIYIMENDIINTPDLQLFTNFELEIKHVWNKSIFILKKK